MTTTESMILTTKEAKIILDWDDGQWYISNIDYSTNDDPTTNDGSTTAVTGGGIKVPEWDQFQKYNKNDIIAYLGVLYVSSQDQNQKNLPNAGTFWWNLVVNFKNIDAITVEGKNFNEIVRAVLGGNLISDYYKKTETNTLILTYFNNVNAKKLNDWTLTEIKNDYNQLITAAINTSKQYTEWYLTNDGVSSFDQSLVDEFNRTIALDTINQI